MKYIFLSLLATATLKATPLKVIQDGHSVFCPPTEFQAERPSKKAIQLELVKKEINSNQASITLEAKIVTCADKKWELDSNPANEGYVTVDENNQELLVNIFYSKAKIKVLDENYSVLAEVELKDLFQDSKQQLEIHFPLSNSKMYEFAFFSEKATVANHYFDKLNLFWGSFYLVLK